MRNFNIRIPENYQKAFSQLMEEVNEYKKKEGLQIWKIVYLALLQHMDKIKSLKK